jgi:hypothetical protein
VRRRNVQKVVPMPNGTELRTSIIMIMFGRVFVWSRCEVSVLGPLVIRLKR